LYDEGFGQRPWRGMQREFVNRYTAYLRSVRKDAGKTETEVKETPEYQQLDSDAKAALDKVKDDVAAKDKQVARIQSQLDAVTDPFQNQRGRIVVITFKLETSPKGGFWERHYKSQLDSKKKEKVSVDMPPDNGGKPVAQQMDFQQLEDSFNQLREQK